MIDSIYQGATDPAHWNTVLPAIADITTSVWAAGCQPSQPLMHALGHRAHLLGKFLEAGNKKGRVVRALSRSRKCSRNA